MIWVEDGVELSQTTGRCPTPHPPKNPFQRDYALYHPSAAFDIFMPASLFEQTIPFSLRTCNTQTSIQTAAGRCAQSLIFHPNCLFSCQAAFRASLSSCISNEYQGREHLGSSVSKLPNSRYRGLLRAASVARQCCTIPDINLGINQDMAIALLTSHCYLHVSACIFICYLSAWESSRYHPCEGWQLGRQTRHWPSFLQNLLCFSPHPLLRSSIAKTLSSPADQAQKRPVTRSFHSWSQQLII